MRPREGETLRGVSRGEHRSGNIELHDVVLVTGTHIEATYDQLMDRWFGDPLRVHIDSWLELRIVDGQRVTLRPEAPGSALCAEGCCGSSLRRKKQLFPD